MMPARLAMGSMITSAALPPSGTPQEAEGSPVEEPRTALIEHPEPEEDASSPENETTAADDQLVEAARRIAADAELHGVRLSQTALADRLRQEGWKIANNRLSWLAATISLGSRYA
jgi:hypothetical protein